MKRFVLSMLATSLVTGTFAQSPNLLQYQAIIRNTSGQVVANQAIGMRVSLLKSSASGTVVYSETHQDTTTTNGLITVDIGAGTPASGSFGSINWGQGPYFIKTETDITGGTNYLLIGTTQLLSVPYSLYAQSASLKYSAAGDTLFSGKEYVIVPGLSASNQSAQGTGTPTLTTTPAVNIAESTATLGGNITAQGSGAISTRGICYALTGSPTTANFTATSGTGIGSFQVNLTGLSSGTTYYVRAFATNNSGTNYGNQVMFSTTGPFPGDCSGKVKDIDGNEYSMVKIGNQCWIQENLRVTRFRNGNEIPLDTSGGTTGDGSGQTWRSLLSAARTAYNHDLNGVTTNGYLYNAYAARDARGICPVGWHLPSNSEWVTLGNTLGGELVAGGKLKSVGTSLWKSPNEGADNTSGFNANPTGYREIWTGKFLAKGEAAIYWTATDGGTELCRELHYNSRVLRAPTLVSYNQNPPNGLSVRCIRD